MPGKASARYRPLELPRRPLLDDFIIAHGKPVAQVEVYSQEGLVVKPPEEDARIFAPSESEYA